MKTEGSPTGKLRRCAAAPCPCRDRVVRDVSCVTCRACDVARDRSIGRESGEGSVSGGVEEIWPKFLLLLLLLLLLCHFRLLSKMLHEEIRQLRFTK